MARCTAHVTMMYNNTVATVCLHKRDDHEWGRRFNLPNLSPSLVQFSFGINPNWTEQEKLKLSL